MDIVIGVLFTAFVIAAAYFALKQNRQNRGKSYDQRRNETYERYEKRIEEFRVSGNDESRDGDSSEGEQG